MAAIAHCRACDSDFALRRLLDDWRCCCPKCDEPLAQRDDDRALLLRKAAIADRLETELVETLSQIASVKGNIEIRISPIVTRLLRDIDWDRQLHDDLMFAQREITSIRDAIRQWAARLRDPHKHTGDDALPGQMRELANRLRQVGESLDHTRHDHMPMADSASVRAAAISVDGAAANLADGRGSQSELIAALDDAADAITATRAHDASSAPEH